MSRGRSRVSRGLIAVLVVVLALGLAFYLHKLSKTDASAPVSGSTTSGTSSVVKPTAAPPVVAQSAPAPKTVAKVEPAALVTETPTAPTTPAASPAPTTKPASS